MHVLYNYATLGLDNKLLKQTIHVLQTNNFFFTFVDGILL